MEGIITIITAAIGVVAAYVTGYYLGRDRGFAEGINLAVHNLKDVYEAARRGEEEIQNETREIIEIIKADNEGRKPWIK